MKTLFRILGTAAAVAVTGAAIVVLDTRQRRGQDARSSTTHIYQVGQRTNLKN